jgi:ABC-type transporter Mla subunit MlaD
MTALTGHADDLVVSARPVVASLDHAVTSVSTTVDAVRDPLAADLAQLQRTLESAQAVLDGAHHLVGDNEGDIQQIVRSLRTASENARLLTETLKERPWNLIRTSQPGDRKVPR